MQHGKNAQARDEYERCFLAYAKTTGKKRKDEDYCGPCQAQPDISHWSSFLLLM
jgi:hypothetical protein